MAVAFQKQGLVLGRHLCTLQLKDGELAQGLRLPKHQSPPVNQVVSKHLQTVSNHA
jgi:hypothetical protein